MAYGAKNISYLDLRPSIAIGVKLPFDSPSVFTSVYTTKEQTKYNIINYLLTDNRERIMNPGFGAGLRSRLFEQITSTSMDELELSLISQIEANFPNIEIIELTVKGQPNYNSINIRFSYRIKSTSETDTANIVIQNT